MPSVVTVHGSRGDLANSLRLDLLVDDQILNCAEVIGASQTKALLMLRTPKPGVQEQAMGAGIGVVDSLADTLEVLERLHEFGDDRRRSLTKLSEWFSGTKSAQEATLPMNPRQLRPLARKDGPEEG